jgi:hypothetical protein
MPTPSQEAAEKVSARLEKHDHKWGKKLRVCAIDDPKRQRPATLACTPTTARTAPKYREDKTEHRSGANIATAVALYFRACYIPNVNKEERKVNSGGSALTHLGAKAFRYDVWVRRNPLAHTLRHSEDPHIHADP